MSEAKHTRGPWMLEPMHTENNGQFHEASIWAEGNGTAASPDRHVAVVRCGLKESEANARLIAAAPELLQTCKLMLDFCPPGLLPSLYAAIDKAEGHP